MELLLVLCIDLPVLGILRHKKIGPLRKRMFPLKKHLRKYVNSCKIVRLPLERSDGLISMIYITL